MNEYNYRIKDFQTDNINFLNLTTKKAFCENKSPETAELEDITNLKEILKETKKGPDKGFFKDLSDEEIEERLNQISEKNNPLNKLKNIIFKNKNKACSVTSAEIADESLPNKIGSASDVKEISNQTSLIPTIGASENFTYTLDETNGKQTLSLKAADTLNLTVLSGQNTYFYTIKSVCNQNVTMQVQDGLLLITGDNLSVQTADDQFSNIAIIGALNTIKIGTEGKTYEGHNISYQSSESGHSIYNWGNYPQADIALSRNASATITATSEEKIINLTNPFTGKNYTYKVKTRQDIKAMEGYKTDSTFLDSQEVGLQFLANGRLVITCNYVDIKAANGQQDDIILLGAFNNIDVGDEDDIVRVGYAIDSKGSYVVSAATYDEVGNPTDKYKSYQNGHGRAATNTIWADCAVGNHIKTGDGDDHVTMMLYKYDDTTTIDMGEGFDTFMTTNGTSTKDANGNYFKFSESTLATNNKLTGAEQASSRYETDKTFTNGTSTYDGNDGWSRQGGSGDCRFFALINSLFQCGTHQISDFVDIDNSTNPNYYKVTFKNYDPQDWIDTTSENRTNTIVLKKTDVEAYLGAAGDMDTVIIDMALNKLLEINQDRGKTTVYTAHWNTISRYIYGNELFSFFTPSQLTQTKLLSLWNKYKTGEIDNITLSLNGDQDTSLGKVGSHAYTIKDIKVSSSGEIEYIELINPWDDRDCVRYDWTTFKSDDFQAYLYIYGYSVDGRALKIYEN